MDRMRVTYQEFLDTPWEVIKDFGIVMEGEAERDRRESEKIKKHGR